MTNLTQAWPRPTQPAPHRHHRRRRHRPHRAPPGLSTARLSRRRCVRRQLRDVAKETAALFDVERVFHSLDEACRARRRRVRPRRARGSDPRTSSGRLPEGSGVLMQKPMGRDLAEARRIRQIARDRGLVAAVNLQLRFSPEHARAARSARAAAHSARSSTSTSASSSISRGTTGRFIEGAPRLEVPYHSIHYIDLIRSIAGEPEGVYCKAIPHPELPRLRDTPQLDHPRLRRSHPLLARPEPHAPRGSALSRVAADGRRHARRRPAHVGREPVVSQRAAGHDGGLYRRGVAHVPLRGSWFIEAFEGPMSNLQRVIGRRGSGARELG